MNFLIDKGAEKRLAEEFLDESRGSFERNGAASRRLRRHLPLRRRSLLKMSINRSTTYSKNHFSLEVVVKIRRKGRGSTGERRFSAAKLEKFAELSGNQAFYELPHLLYLTAVPIDDQKPLSLSLAPSKYRFVRWKWRFNRRKSR